MRSVLHYSWLTLVALLICGCDYDPRSAVCQVVVDLPGSDDSQGSGTLVAVNGKRGLVLTCRHVAEQVGNTVMLTWPNGQSTIGVVYKIVPGNDYRTDQALVVCERPNGVKPLPVGKFDPTAGPIVSVGWRSGEFYEAVAFDARESDGLIESNQPFIGGMSGGPTLQNGVVVGVAVGSNRKDYSVSSNGDALVQLIQSVSK